MSKRYESNTTIEKIAQRLQSAKRVVLTTHMKPDGDAIGSTVAMAHALQHLGVETQIWYIPPLPDTFASLLQGIPVHLIQKNKTPCFTDENGTEAEADTIIVTDTGATPQLVGLRKWLAERNDRIIVLDHHIQGNPDFGTYRYVDTTVSAASQIAANLIDILGCKYNKQIADALYIGIATDTGWFRFSNVHAETFQLAARLLKTGADHVELHRLCEQTDKPSRMRLLARALESMQLVGNERFAILTLHPQDFTDAGALQIETHGISDIPNSIGSVLMTCLVSQFSPDHTVKLSFRSKPGPHAVDVNALAAHFNGGGHARAAGAKVPGQLEEVRDQLITILES